MRQLHWFNLFRAINSEIRSAGGAEAEGGEGEVARICRIKDFNAKQPTLPQRMYSTRLSLHSHKSSPNNPWSTQHGKHFRRLRIRLGLGNEAKDLRSLLFFLGVVINGVAMWKNQGVHSRRTLIMNGEAGPAGVPIHFEGGAALLQFDRRRNRSIFGNRCRDSRIRS